MTSIHTSSSGSKLWGHFKKGLFFGVFVQRLTVLLMLDIWYCLFFYLVLPNWLESLTKKNSRLLLCPPSVDRLELFYWAINSKCSVLTNYWVKININNFFWLQGPILRKKAARSKGFTASCPSVVSIQFQRVFYLLYAKRNENTFCTSSYRCLLIWFPTGTHGLLNRVFSWTKFYDYSSAFWNS